MARPLILAGLALAPLATGCGSDCSFKKSFVADADGDGFPNIEDTTTACEAPPGYTTRRDDERVDCDDTNPDAHPDGVEVCDELGVDEDCNGVANDQDVGVDAENTGTAWYQDGDGDGFGDASDPTWACEDPSVGSVVYMTEGTDCDDNDRSVNPDATEVCDGGQTDEDCDGLVDDDDPDLDTTSLVDWYPDEDGDGHGQPESTAVQSCLPPTETGWADTDDDCDDDDETVYPGAPELCDGRTTDCRGKTAAEGVSFIDADGVSTDLTDTFNNGTEASPVIYTLKDPGTLVVCDGTWYVHLAVAADEVTIMGEPSSDAVMDNAGRGRALDVRDNAVTLKDITLTGGYTSRGAGIACEGGSLVATDVNLVGNDATSLGGALHLSEGCQAELTNVFIDHNTAPTGAALYATGLGTSVSLSELTVSWNEWTTGGGVAIADGASATLTDVILTANDGEDGGSLAVRDATATVTSCEISENDTANGPGLYVTGSEASVTVEDSTFSENEATESGGGVYLSDGATLELATVSFLDNTAEDWGGAVYLEGAHLVGRDVTFQKNRSFQADDGAAVNFEAAGVGTMELTDPVFAENEPNDVWHWELEADYTASSGADIICDTSGCFDD